MSAEAPRSNDAGEPIPPQRREGGFSRFLRGFLKLPFEIQQVQPDPELSDFAGKIQQVVGGHLATVRQQEVSVRNREATLATLEAEERARVAQRQRELEQKRATAMTEANGILSEFRVEERLRYIQRAVWEGRGRIRIIEPEFGTNSDRLGGLELVHQYPFFRYRTKEIVFNSWDGGSRTESQYAPDVAQTSLSIIISRKQGSGEGEETLDINSQYEVGTREQRTPRFRSETVSIIGVHIPISTTDSRTLLDSAFAQETTYRLTNQLLPSQLEKNAGRILAEVQRLPSWSKWTSYSSD
ncbi:hypothetical protein HYT17_03065 [Candidatus Microgenomates bacterium]|nr:hypothetical protein [Candidatus Microgenomates bacterium]